jgi:hypothetical protein
MPPDFIIWLELPQMPRSIKKATANCCAFCQVYKKGLDPTTCASRGGTIREDSSCCFSNEQNQPLQTVARAAGIAVPNRALMGGTVSVVRLVALSGPGGGIWRLAVAKEGSQRKSGASED